MQFRDGPRRCNRVFFRKATVFRNTVLHSLAIIAEPEQAREGRMDRTRKSEDLPAHDMPASAWAENGPAVFLVSRQRSNLPGNA